MSARREWREARIIAEALGASPLKRLTLALSREAEKRYYAFAIARLRALDTENLSDVALEVLSIVKMIPVSARWSTSILVIEFTDNPAAWRFAAMVDTWRELRASLTKKEIKALERSARVTAGKAPSNRDVRIAMMMGETTVS